MNTALYKAISSAADEKENVGRNLLRAINELAKCAWVTPVEFYLTLGTNAAAEAQRHRALFLALKAVAPDLASQIEWPPFEVIYLPSGQAIPTSIPFVLERDTLFAPDEPSASALAASLGGSIMS